MQTTRRLQFVHAQLAWMLGAILLLALLGALTLELFFVVSLIGLLIAVELTASVRVTPRWRRRLRLIIAVGLLGFGLLVVRRILELLPPGVV
jgi:threonine/homoserine/homoserine lactone efflux protein